jgi:hypothetical protein
MRVLLLKLMVAVMEPFMGLLTFVVLTEARTVLMSMPM